MKPTHVTDISKTRKDIAVYIINHWVKKNAGQA